MTASPGSVLGKILDGDLYGTLKTIDSILALLGALRIPYTLRPLYTWQMCQTSNNFLI